MAYSSEDVLLQIGHVKHKKDDGTLYLMSERLAWIQGNRDTVTLSHKYADIKSQKISPEGKPKIQLQIVLHNNSAFTFHFVNPAGASAQFNDRDQAKEFLIQLLPKFRRKVDRELEDKNRILGENETLLQLYKDLVMDGIVTSEEFWADHAQHLMGNQSKSAVQEVGVSSGFLSGIQPETDGANGLRYNLTHDVMDCIFKTYPAVKRKHIECVPGELSEAQFWTKFFQSHYFHRDRLLNLKDLFSDCAKSDEREMRRQLDRVRLLNAEVVSTLEEGDGEGLAEKDILPLPEKSDKNISPQGIHRNMIKRFNQHSIMVLKACEKPEPSKEPNGEVNGAPSKKKRKDEPAIVEEVPIEPPDEKKARLLGIVELSDLKPEEVYESESLKLTRVDRYLNGPVADHKTDTVAPEQVVHSATAMKELAKRWGTKPQLLDAKTAVQILVELSPGGSLMKDGRADSNGTQSIGTDAENDVRKAYVCASELLRHFWSCFPPTSPSLEEKIIKTRDKILKFEQIKLQQLKDRLHREHINSQPVMNHLNQLLAAAHAKFQIFQTQSRRR